MDPKYCPVKWCLKYKLQKYKYLAFIEILLLTPWHTSNSKDCQLLKVTTISCELGLFITIIRDQKTLPMCANWFINY